MQLDGKRFLLIGGAGLIGSHTVDQLLQENVAEIRIFDNLCRGNLDNIQAALRDPRVNVFPHGGDILHRDVLRDALEGIDGVFHFAALWLLHCHDYPRSAFDVNIGGTFNVLEACIACGIKRLVFSSSASVYGDAVEEPMTEQHPFNTTNFYGATKVAGEMMCRALYHQHKDSRQQFDYVGLRYMNVYGPRQDYHGAYVSVIMKILDRLDEGLSPVVYGDGLQAYDFVSVTDCAAANICAMKSDRSDRFYNVGTGVKTTIKELAQHIIELSGANVTIQFEPSGPTFVKNRVGCIERALDEIGFEAKVKLRDGLRELIDWRTTENSKG